MKKILNEIKRMQELAGVINENINSDRYSMDCEVDIDGYGITYKGKEIDWMVSDNIRLSFLIDMEAREWGIKYISLYDVKGPSELEIKLAYFPDETNDSIEEYVKIPIDWEKVKMEKNDQLQYIGIDSKVRFDLANDNDGNIMIDKIEVVYNDL